MKALLIFIAAATAFLGAYLLDRSMAMPCICVAMLMFVGGLIMAVRVTESEL